MKVRQTDLPGVLLIQPEVFTDERGFFLETFRQDRYERAGAGGGFRQGNRSRSRQGVLRGMHYQLGQPQAKLVWVSSGSVFDVAVDVRAGSPTFGRWTGHELSADNKLQLYIPQGFAHGFYVLSEWADFEYLCSDYYAPAEERSIRWDDPQVGIAWPQGERIVSPRDAQAPLLREQQDLPVWPGND